MSCEKYIEFSLMYMFSCIAEHYLVAKCHVSFHEASPAWMWPAVAVATGLGVAAAVIITVVFLWLKTRRQRREGGERVRHRSTVTDSNNGSKAWTRHSEEKRSRSGRDKDRNGTKKNKKGKESGKRRKEPLGEDAIRMR